MVLFKKSKTLEKKIIPHETDEPLTEMHLGKSSDASEEGQLSLDVFQTKDEIVVIAPVAGVKKNDLNISINDDVLTIQGERQFSFHVERENYVHQECYWGNFSRSVILPEQADIRHAKASFKDGILIVRIPKTERMRNKVLEIREE